MTRSSLCVSRTRPQLIVQLSNSDRKGKNLLSDGRRILYLRFLRHIEVISLEISIFIRYAVLDEWRSENKQNRNEER